MLMKLLLAFIVSTIVLWLMMFNVIDDTYHYIVFNLMLFTGFGIIGKVI